MTRGTTTVLPPLKFSKIQSSILTWTESPLEQSDTSEPHNTVLHREGLPARADCTKVHRTKFHFKRMNTPRIETQRSFLQTTQACFWLQHVPTSHHKLNIRPSASATALSWHKATHTRATRRPQNHSGVGSSVTTNSRAKHSNEKMHHAKERYSR